MKRRAATLLGLVGMASLGACGRSDVLYKDDQYGAHGARGGSGGSGAHATGGTTSTGGTGATGGSFGTGATGGSFGTGATGGSFGTGGTVITGGSAGKGGRGGAGGAAGASGQGPYACQHTTPTCDTFTNFSTDQSISWGSGVFTGGISVFGNGIFRDMSTDHVHVTGTVSDYTNGIIIYFATCADLSKYAGVYFTMSGTTGFNDEILVMPWTNSDYPWQQQPSVMRGACTASNPMNPFVECMAPEQLTTLYSSRQYAYWSDFSGGAPVAWNSNTSPSEIVGIQWLFPFDPSFGAYNFDVTLDDVGFIRSGSAAPDCGPAAGAGGMGGVAGMAGMSGSGAGGFAGVAGTSTGGAGAGGVGGFSFGGFSGFNLGGNSAGGFAGFDNGGFSGFNLGGNPAGGFSGSDNGGFSGFNLGGNPAGGFAGTSVGGDASGGISAAGFSGSGGVSTGGESTGGQATAGIAGTL